MSTHTFEEDNYLPCEIYAQHAHDADGFARFYHDEDSQWYFAYFRHNKVFLRSEGYSNEPARENGISSVLKNFGDDANYQLAETSDGKWVLRLRAANNKEIACSCPYNSEAEARSHLPGKTAHPAHDDDYLACSAYEGHPTLPDHPNMAKFEHDGEFLFVVYDKSGNVRFRSERYTTETARDNGFDSVIRNQHDDARYSIQEKFDHFFVVLKAANHQEIARSCPYDSEQAAKKQLPSAIKSAGHDDDYLACSAYENHERLAEESDVAKFTVNEDHLFVVYTDDGKVLLRSERYSSASARDNGLESVLKNRDNDERYVIEEKIHHFFLVLKAANHQEIARSCPFDSKKQAEYYLPSAIAARNRKNEANKLHHEDNYLACTHYESRVRTEENSEFTAFIHNELYYFALIDSDGDVLLRSEGYHSATARDNGIQSVIKNRGIRERYQVTEFHGAYFVKLMAANNKEIARSCPSNEEDAMALISLLTAASHEPAVDPVPLADISTAKKPGFNWWWLLLLLFGIILIGLWLRSCNSAETPGTAMADCGLQPILFEFDSDEIPEDGRIELEEMAALMNENPGFTARIEAFTDSVGTYDYNKDLSRRRCEAARAVLTASGIVSTRISIDPEAYLEPVAKNTTDDSGRQFNRRVELMVFDADGNTVCDRVPMNIPEELRLD